MSKVKELEVKIEQLKKRKQLLLNKERSDERKKDTRRKILMGAVVIKEIEQNENLKNYILKVLDRDLLKDRDRVLFDLKPKCANIESVVD